MENFYFTSNIYKTVFFQQLYFSFNKKTCWLHRLKNTRRNTREIYVLAKNQNMKDGICKSAECWDINESLTIGFRKNS